MSEITGTPALNKALAEFQAELPRVTKDNKAKVDHKDGGSHSYKYADLADISQVALPLLGKFGLAFTSKPTMRFTESGTMFVLHYRLTHSSGEADEGFYELPSPAKVGPQVVGSHITYARRYCLCAVTGIHPDGEDDDGAVAQAAARSAGDAWDNAAPAQPRRNGNGQANGHANGNGNGQRVQQHATGELDPDAQQYADEAHEALALSTLREIRTRAEAKGKLESLVRNPATNRAGVLGPFLDYHERRLTEIDAALAQLTVAAKKAKVEGPELDIHVKQVTGATIEAATAAQLRQAAEAFTAGAAS